MSEFKRPPGVGDDPEAQYRAGYQHGAQAAMNTKKSKSELKRWIEIVLQKWRHDRNADPKPPE